MPITRRSKCGTEAPHSLVGEFRLAGVENLTILPFLHGQSLQEALERLFAGIFGSGLGLITAVSDLNPHRFATASQLPAPRIRALSRIDRFDIVIRRHCDAKVLSHAKKIGLAPMARGALRAGVLDNLRWLGWHLANDPANCSHFDAPFTPVAGAADA
jgi:hypothetical protein